MTPPRVVSLLSSATDTVFALGLGDALVGRSHECDHPESARLPSLSKPKLDAAAKSSVIDRDVKTLVEKGLSVYEVDAEALRALRPDVILTQTQCAVCAVSEEDVERALRDWTGTRPNVVSLKPQRLDDVWADVGRVADALGVPAKGWELVEGLKTRAAAVAARGRVIPGRPAVACLEWIEPLMAAGNWVPELVEMAGGVNLFGEAGKHSPWMEYDDLTDADPDVIAVLPCGFDVPRTRREMPALTGRPGWLDLRAVRCGDVYLLDGSRFFNRPGPRLVESLEILAEIFHPAAFAFGHEGSGWQRL